jgi:hypothetical protein
MHSNVKITTLPDTIQLIEMNDEEYFSDKWAEWISNSKLALINPDQDGSPEVYREGLSKHQKYSDSLVFGSAVHELVLQPESFILAEGVDRPTAKLGAMADELFENYLNDLTDDKYIIAASNKIDYYKGKMDKIKIQNVLDKCEEYWKSKERWHKNYSGDKEPIFLDSKSREKLKLCLASVDSNQEIQSLLHPKGVLEDPISMNEAALFIQVKAEYNGKETILKLKGKLDNFTIDTETGEVTLNDLKTTGHKLIDFKDSFKKYHYNRQMAMYSWMLRLYVMKQYNTKPSSLYANMLLVSTVPDYRAGIFKVTNREIRNGFLEFKDLLQRVAYLELHD